MYCLLPRLCGVDGITYDMHDRHLSVALVVDLSKPEELWLMVDHWIEVIKSRIAAVLSESDHTDQSFQDKLRQSAWQRVGEKHEVTTH